MIFYKEERSLVGRIDARQRHLLVGDPRFHTIGAGAGRRHTAARAVSGVADWDPAKGLAVEVALPRLLLFTASSKAK